LKFDFLWKISSNYLKCVKVTRKLENSKYLRIFHPICSTLCEIGQVSYCTILFAFASQNLIFALRNLKIIFLQEKYKLILVILFWMERCSSVPNMGTLLWNNPRKMAMTFVIWLESRMFIHQRPVCEELFQQVVKNQDDYLCT
jgi:hypothetical protein